MRIIISSNYCKGVACSQRDGRISFRIIFQEGGFIRMTYGPISGVLGGLWLAIYGIALYLFAGPANLISQILNLFGL